MSTSEVSSSPGPRILAYVEQRINSQGTRGLSVEEISSALGMSKKTFYKAFPTKEAMLEELIGRIVGELAGRIDGIVQSPGSFVQKIDGLMTMLGTLYPRMAILLSEDLYRSAPAVWSRVEEFRHRKIQTVFSALLDQGIAEGSIGREVNRTIFLLAYLAAIRAIINPRVLVEHPFSAIDAVEQIVRIFFAGIMTDEGRSAFAALHTKRQSHST